jgi:hypothetical protein
LNGTVVNETTLAVIVHADIVDSTGHVQIDERIAHQRFREAFDRLSGVIDSHGGCTHELREVLVTVQT